MTPLETEVLQHLGITYLYNVEELSIGVFFYGASSSLVVYDPLHKFDQRSLCSTLLCVGCYLRVRFLLPASCLFLSET